MGTERKTWSWIGDDSYYLMVKPVKQQVFISIDDGNPRGGYSYDIPFAEFLDVMPAGNHTVTVPAEILKDVIQYIVAITQNDHIAEALEKEKISKDKDSIASIRTMLAHRDVEYVRQAIELVEGLCKEDPTWAFEIVQDLEVGKYFKLLAPSWLCLALHQYHILIWLLGLRAKLGEKSTIKRIDVNRKELAVLHDNIRYLDSVEEVYLSLDMNVDNRFKTLPEGFFLLKNLKILQINNPDLNSISPGIGKLTKLEQVYITAKKIQELPVEIADLENIVELYLRCSIENLPEEIGQLNKLRKLNLCDNQLSSLPKGFGSLLP